MRYVYLFLICPYPLLSLSTSICFSLMTELFMRSCEAVVARLEAATHQPTSGIHASPTTPSRLEVSMDDFFLQTPYIHSYKTIPIFIYIPVSIMDIRFSISPSSFRYRIPNEFTSPIKKSMITLFVIWH